MDQPRPTTTLSYQGLGVQIDTELAPLLTVLWEQGIETSRSGHSAPTTHTLGRDEAYITFASRAELFELLHWRVVLAHYSRIDVAGNNLVVARPNQAGFTRYGPEGVYGLSGGTVSILPRY
jgi:hypothetical protein